MEKLVLILILIATISCGQSKENTDNEVKEKMKLDFNNKIIEKYNVKYSFDTIDNFKYSIDFKDLISTENQFIRDFQIRDIYEKDNDYFLKVETWGSMNTFYFDLKIKNEGLNKIRKLTTWEDYEKNGYYENDILVVKIEYIKKIDFIIEGEIGEYDEYSEEYGVDLNINSSLFNGVFLCKGEFIDYIKID
tara:strand:- start:445 stop:1017 length:573 start_codon:yes stop_codon:yes gene_type:complete